VTVEDQSHRLRLEDVVRHARRTFIQVIAADPEVNGSAHWAAGRC
jgi:hypothetical protein